MDVELPSYVDLMAPTLRAIDQLGGVASAVDLDQRVIELAGITDQQLAVMYPDGAAQTGSKVKHRLAWARTYLRKLDAVERLERGTWSITAVGRRYIATPDGENDLRRNEHELRIGRRADDFLAKVNEQLNRNERYQTTVRDLLAEWGVKRRGSEVLARVIHDLSSAGLRTDPSFADVGLDNSVDLIRGSRSTSANELPSHAEPLDDASDHQLAISHDLLSYTVRIGNIASANTTLARVPPDEPILKAQSLMESRNYSQLAVMSGERELKGAISWESIAQASLHRGDLKLVKDAMISKPVVVDHADPLLEHVGTIASAGFVFVRDSHHKISGIVTTADLSTQFAQLANPFLLLGEVERLLRVAVDNAFAPDDLALFADPDDPEREVEAAESLTLGEYVRLFQNPEAWNRLGWAVDRQVFYEHVDRVRTIRNEIMHFSTDPIDPSDVEEVMCLLRWLRRLVS